jgi:hypothetical protein
MVGRLWISLGDIRSVEFEGIFGVADGEVGECGFGMYDYEELYEYKREAGIERRLYRSRRGIASQGTLRHGMQANGKSASKFAWDGLQYLHEKRYPGRELHTQEKLGADHTSAFFIYPLRI